MIVLTFWPTWSKMIWIFINLRFYHLYFGFLFDKKIKISQSYCTTGVAFGGIIIVLLRFSIILSLDYVAVSYLSIRACFISSSWETVIWYISIPVTTNSTHLYKQKNEQWQCRALIYKSIENVMLHTLSCDTAVPERGSS